MAMIAMGLRWPFEAVRQTRFGLVAKHGRNVYIDFFRGTALWWIFIDHMPWNQLVHVTFLHLGLCDAFELFVLIAGLSAGYAYGPVLFRHGTAVASKKILCRIGILYVANLALLCGLWAEVALLGESRTGRLVVDMLKLNELQMVSIENISAMLVFDYPTNFVCILRLYILLFLGLVVLLPLLRFPRVLLSISIALYAVNWLFHLHIPGSENAVPNYNPFAWQVLLLTGAVLAVRPSLLPPPHLAWDLLAVFILLLAFAIRISVYLAGDGYGVAIMHGSPAAPVITWMQDALIGGGSKLELHPLRLANILAWAWLAYRFAPFYAACLHQLWTAPFILCGRHSLPVFCCGVLLAPLGGIFLGNWPGLFDQVACNVTGAAILVTVAALTAAAKSRQSRIVSRMAHPLRGRTG